MAKFKGGLEEAIKMLQGLGADQAKKLIEQIREKDPKMAQSLEDNMVGLDDLQYCSAAQLVGLLRDLDLEEFGLALRTVDPQITQKILDMVSTGIRLDIEDGLKGGPRPVSQVQEAQNKIIQIMKQKVDQGQLSISPDGDEYV